MSQSGHTFLAKTSSPLYPINCQFFLLSWILKWQNIEKHIILYNVRKNIEKNALHFWSKKRRSINEIWRVLIIFVTPFPLCFKSTFLNDQITAHLKHVSRLINKLGPKLRYQTLAKIMILGNLRHKEVKFHVPLPMRMEMLDYLILKNIL